MVHNLNVSEKYKPAFAPHKSMKADLHHKYFNFFFYFLYLYEIICQRLNFKCVIYKIINIKILKIIPKVIHISKHETCPSTLFICFGLNQYLDTEGITKYILDITVLINLTYRYFITKNKVASNKPKRPRKTQHNLNKN